MNRCDTTNGSCGTIPGGARVWSCAVVVAATFKGGTMRRIILLGLIGIGMTVVSKSASAQACGYLQWCWETVHKMPPLYSGFFDAPHESCNVCPGYILDCHKECGVSDDLIA